MAPPGKVALVTGGGRGLGRAMALGLSRAGCRVAITAARSRAEIEAVARDAPQGQIYPLLVDVSRESACAALVKEVEAQLGPVEVLVNNAGRGDALCFGTLSHRANPLLGDGPGDLEDDH